MLLPIYSHLLNHVPQINPHVELKTTNKIWSQQKHGGFCVCCGDINAFVANRCHLSDRAPQVGVWESVPRPLRCSKYTFVQTSTIYGTQTREVPDSRLWSLGLQTDGLRDKVVGLVSTVAMSLRFNRALIVRSAQNEMHEVFRPYHPTDIHSQTPKYAWDNFTSWSNIDWKYAKYVNRVHSDGRTEKHPVWTPHPVQQSIIHTTHICLPNEHIRRRWWGSRCL